MPCLAELSRVRAWLLLVVVALVAQLDEAEATRAWWELEDEERGSAAYVELLGQVAVATPPLLTPHRSLLTHHRERSFSRTTDRFSRTTERDRREPMESRYRGSHCEHRRESRRQRDRGRRETDRDVWAQVVTLGSKRNWLAANARGSVHVNFDDDDIYCSTYVTITTSSTIHTTAGLIQSGPNTWQPAHHLLCLHDRARPARPLF